MKTMMALMATAAAGVGGRRPRRRGAQAGDDEDHGRLRGREAARGDGLPAGRHGPEPGRAPQGHGEGRRVQDPPHRVSNVSPDGTVWFGTPNGVSALADGQWHSYSSGLPSNDISCLDVDSDGVAWIGTGSGLAVIDKGEVRSPKNRLLPQETIVGIVADSAGFIWIASATRVVRVARERLLHGDVSDADVREYGVPDGLQSTEGVRRYRSAVADASGRVWLSLGRGLSMTDPSRRAATAPVPDARRVGPR